MFHFVLRYEVEEHPLYDSSDEDNLVNEPSGASAIAAPSSAANSKAAAGSNRSMASRLNLATASKPAQLGGKGRQKKLPGSSGVATGASKRWQAERAVKAAAALTRERAQRKAKAEARKREAGGGGSGRAPERTEGVGEESGKESGARKRKEAAEKVAKRNKLTMRDAAFVGKLLTAEQVQSVIGDAAARSGVLKAMVCVIWCKPSRVYNTYPFTFVSPS